jgi:hypothetical protein
LRILSIIGLLVTVAIIGWFAATYLSVAAGPVQFPSSVESSRDGAETSAQSAIDRARSVVSMDKERQLRMQSQMDRLNGAAGEP